MAIRNLETIRNDCYVFRVAFFCSQWFNILNRVHRATEEDLRGMREESANVKHAVVRCLRLWEILFGAQCGHFRRSARWSAAQKTAKPEGGAWPGKEFALTLSAFSPPYLSAVVFRRVPAIWNNSDRLEEASANGTQVQFLFVVVRFRSWCCDSKLV